MTNRIRSLLFIPLAMAALFLGTAAPASAQDPFDEADIFFELNHTDGDLGIHALLDGDAWRELRLETPDGKERLVVTAKGTLRRHGLTELFFESAEPPFDEVPPGVFFRRFPEGEWEISGITIEGDELESTDELRHVLPAPPSGITLSGEPAAANCDVDPLPSVAEPVVIKWNPVTTSHPTIGKSGPIEVVRYQLVLELEDSELALSVDLPPNVTEFEVPEDFTALADAFKFEILVREETGNQTAVESCFEIE